LAGWFEKGYIACISRFRKMRWDLVKVNFQGDGILWVRSNELGGNFRGALIFSRLIQMPLHHRYRPRGVPAESLGYEAGTIDQLAMGEGLFEG
jgi:hypothetical protein